MHRRQFLFGSVASVVSSATVAQPAAQISTLSDGFFTMPSSFLARESDQAKANEVLKAAGAFAPEHRNPINVTLLRRGEEIILFDCGAGPNFMTGAGKLQEALTAASVDVEKVSHVLFTHAHPDHLWGALDDFGTPAFPNAKYHISLAERDFWMSPQAFTALPESLQSIPAGAQRYLKELSSVLSTFKPGEEVLSGIAAMPTPGHTPGHVSICIESRGQRAIITGDMMHNPIQFERPGDLARFDMDRQQAAATRQAFVDRVANQPILVIGSHFSEPTGGYVVRDTAGCRLHTPAEQAGDKP